jgi:hypothetical protein
MATATAAVRWLIFTVGLLRALTALAGRRAAMLSKIRSHGRGKWRNRVPVLEYPGGGWPEAG